ncbi:MAG: hypothetical protein UX17_C0067G0003 [Parcubacteria group bacterium GW2011_GWC2_45_7]|nr:MAG: hypothetical protein UX17_C0067G0003 [Parcubacteria group bacterium GW2011_GWC2_45_7]
MRQSQQGQMLIQVIIFGAIAIISISGLVGWAVANIKASRQTFYREQAIQIAEVSLASCPCSARFSGWHWRPRPLYS